MPLFAATDTRYGPCSDRDLAEQSLLLVRIFTWTASRLWLVEYGLSLSDRGDGPHFPYVLCDDRRPDPTVAAWLQLQRRCVGRVYRALWHRGGDRRRDGRVSARSTRQTADFRSSTFERRY